MSFSTDVHKIAKRLDSTADQVTRAIKISFFTGIIRDTRVDTGRLRGNWQTSTGTPKLVKIDRLDPEAIESVNEVISNITTDGVDYMANNLPYAKVWEEKDGMVAKNLVRVQRAMRSILAIRDIVGSGSSLTQFERGGT